jgi:uncharacterized protein (TIGR03083 family)
MGWQDTRTEVLSEIDEIVALAGSMGEADWKAPTTCGWWTAGDAAAHVAGSMDIQHTAFQHLLAGDLSTPEWVEGVHTSADESLAALRRSQAKAIEVQGQLTDAHAGQLVPLPIGTFPLEIALDVILLEYGVHRWDIARALDPKAELSPAASACVLRLAPAFISFFAADPPSTPIGYRLQADSSTIDVSLRDGAWVLEASNVPTTVVRGSDSAVSLFALGRIGAREPSLSVEGDDAATFKTWFPGP